jgi:ABC-type lipoprotein export system ATPase subunit
VYRSYGRGGSRVAALRDVSCCVQPGDRIAISGRSGSGKSTLAHLLAGLDQPTTGLVSWPALGSRERLRPARIGVVFQSPSLLSELTVAENVSLPLELAGTAPAEARRRALDALAALGLESLAEQLPDELSGGQAQRVAVARVMASAPPLVIADEPTGQLDHSTAERMLAVLESTCEVLGAALVLTTHDESISARYQQQWRIVDGALDRGGPS